MSNDTYLKQAVLDELQWEPGVNAAHIGVTAKDGIIALMGHVDTYGEKAIAERATRRVKGVKAIAEEITVKLPFSVRHSDEDIAAAAVNRLVWDSTLPKDSIKAEVQNGWVTLTGEVDWHFQQEAASGDVRNLWGVTGVSNNITIRPKPSTAAIKDKILLALDRSWFDPETITVTAHEGKIRLAGTVNTWHERDEACNAAWAAPGTTCVVNDIMVN